MIRTYLGILLPILPLALFTGGCGNGTEAGTTATTGVTKKQFIDRAGSICHRAELERIHKGFAYLREHSGATEQDLVTTVVMPVAEREIRDLRALDLPAGDEPASALISEMTAAMGKLKENPQLIVSDKRNPFQQADKFAKRYGLFGCDGAP